MDARVISPSSAAVLNEEMEMERRLNRVAYPGIECRSLTSRGLAKNNVYGHRLEIARGRDWLPMAIVLSRLNREFRYFETDEELGREHVEQLIACFESSSRHSFSLERQRHLRQLAKGVAQAIYLHFGDNPGSNTEYLETLLLPLEPLVFGYNSVEHQIAASPLVARCANVLTYDIVELRIGR